MFLKLLFMIIVIYSIPQVRDLFPYTFRMLSSFDIYWYDIFTVLALVHYASYILLRRSYLELADRGLHKSYALILIIGLIPLFVGYTRGGSELLHIFRFFAYFFWVPVLTRLFKRDQNPIKLIYVLIAACALSCFLVVIQRFMELGGALRVYAGQTKTLYINHEMALFTSLIALTAILGTKRKSRTQSWLLLSFLIILVALLVDGSRKMYVAIMVGAVISFFLLARMENRWLIRSDTGAIRIVKFVVPVLLFFIIFPQVYEGVSARLSTLKNLRSESGILNSEVSIYLRYLSTVSGLKTLADHPLTGSGTGVQVAYAERLGEAFFSRGIRNRGIYARNPYSFHNFHIQALVAFGIPIYFFISLVVIRLLKYTWKRCKMFSAYDLGNGIYYGPILAGSLSGFISLIVAMFAEGFAIGTIFYLWFFLGIVVGLSRRSIKEM